MNDDVAREAARDAIEKAFAVWCEDFLSMPHRELPAPAMRALKVAFCCGAVSACYAAKTTARPGCSRLQLQHTMDNLRKALEDVSGVRFRQDRSPMTGQGETIQ